MIRYINAGELLEDLKHVYCLSCKKVNTFYCWNTCDVSDIINYVLSYEPADVAPVVHAHWTRKRTLSHDGELYCSNCEWTPEVLGGITLSDLQLADVYYCPHCGAKMDGVV